jgi:hypothetical protein
MQEGMKGRGIMRKWYFIRGAVYRLGTRFKEAGESLRLIGFIRLGLWLRGRA